MSVKIGNIEIGKYIAAPTVVEEWRSRSVKYTIDGTASEQRLGLPKKRIDISFGVISANVWEPIKVLLSAEDILLSGSIGGLSINGTYRIKENEIPTPILMIQNGKYYCNPFSITLEEV